MNYNYHTHTYRCGHAFGTPEEYIKNAISYGVKYLGFSEHIPYEFGDEFSNKYRLAVTETEDYFSEIKALAEKYKDKIDIKIGFEMEYYPDKFMSMLDFARRAGAQFLILGQHFMNGIYTGGSHVINGKATYEDLQNYVMEVTEAMETGVFTYVAHPDMMNFKGDEDLYEKEMRKLCIASKRLDVPLEINCQGIVDNRIYPAERFWKIAGEVGCPVTIGFDAHSAEAMCDDVSVQKAKNMIGKFNLNYIGKPLIVSI